VIREIEPNKGEKKTLIGFPYLIPELMNRELDAMKQTWANKDKIVVVLIYPACDERQLNIFKTDMKKKGVEVIEVYS